MAERGGPGIEEHVDGGERADGEQFLARLVGSDFFDAQVAAEDAPDGRNLFGVSERLRAGEDIFGAGVAFFAQCSNRDGGDVALVDRSGGNGEIGPTHDFASANLRGPPKQSIGGEHAGAEKGPPDAGGVDRTFDLFEHRPEPIGLLKERVRRLERSGKVDDLARARAVMRCKAGVIAEAGAVHTRKTASVPSRHASRVSGTVRSPRTTCACGKSAASGWRAMARTCEPAAIS